MSKYSELDICRVNRSVAQDHPFGRPGIILKVFPNNRYLVWLAESKLNQYYDSFENPVKAEINDKNSFFVWENFEIISEANIKGLWHHNLTVKQKENFDHDFLLKICKKINVEIFNSTYALEKFDEFKNEHFSKFFSNFDKFINLYESEMKEKILTSNKQIAEWGLEKLSTVQEKLNTFLLQSQKNFNAINFDQSISWEEKGKKIIFSSELEFEEILKKQTQQCLNFFSKIDLLRSDIEKIDGRLEDFSR